MLNFLSEIEARKVYEVVGISLSETECQALGDLLKYLESYFTRGFDEYYPDLSSDTITIFEVMDAGRRNTHALKELDICFVYRDYLAR